VSAVVVVGSLIVVLSIVDNFVVVSRKSILVSPFAAAIVVICSIFSQQLLLPSALSWFVAVAR